MTQIAIETLTALVLLLNSAQIAASEPAWGGPVVARGPLRAEIEETPVHLRPYRPLHFYGNTLRRSYYRGNPLPLPRDFVGGLRGVGRSR